MPEQLRRFSHSLIDTYLDCPRKAYYRYVEGIDSPKSSALVTGSACDSAWNRALDRKIFGQDPPTVDELKSWTEAAFRADVAEQGGKHAIEWGEGNTATAELARALRLTEQWATGLLPAIEPTATQVEYTRELPSGRAFIGFIDWEGAVDGVPAIGDNKTGGRKLSASGAEKGLQPYAYAWLKHVPLTFVFARAIDTGKTQSSEFVWTTRSEGDIEWYDGLVAEVEGAFASGTFPPNPKSNLCGAKWCSYFSRCQPHRAVSGPTH